MNKDLLGSIKSALEHNKSLEQVVQTFINAGYNPQEVHEAAQALTSGAIPMTSPKTPTKAPTPPTSPKNPPQQVPMQSPVSKLQEPKKHVSRKLATILISVFVFLLALLLLTIVFSDQILNFLF